MKSWMIILILFGVFMILFALQQVISNVKHNYKKVLQNLNNNTHVCRNTFLNSDMIQKSGTGRSIPEPRQIQPNAKPKPNQ